MRKKISKNLLFFLLIAGGLLLARLVFAQDFGTEAVESGLDGALAAGDPRTIAGRIINIALGFLGIIAVGFVIYGGFIWMTSGGEEEKVEKAKKILKSGVIGLVIILASWGIATFILTRLGNAVSGTGGGYEEGSLAPCGCGGSMLYSNGSWGPCVGSDCSGAGIGNPTSCDSSPNPGCQAVNQICASSDYCDEANCACRPRGGLGASCDGDLSNETCEADNDQCAEYLSCNPETCLCYGPPVITEISPLGGFCIDNPNQSCISDDDCSGVCDLLTPNGAVDNFITIFGRNFGEYADGASKVLFTGSGNPVEGIAPSVLNTSCSDFWRDDQIIIAVPAGAISGPIQVVSQEGASDYTDDDFGPEIPNFRANNIVRPGLCYLDPNRGALSSEVNYQGVNLYSAAAYFGNYKTNVRAIESVFTNPEGLSGTSLTPNIKAGESGSFVTVNLSGQAEKSNYLRFVKESEAGDGPFIASFSPLSGAPGQYVTIRGDGFGGARGTSRVFFGATEATYDFPEMCLNSVWKDNQIVVKVPAGLEDGSQVIMVDLGDAVINTEKLNPNIFLADKNAPLAPSLCKLEPLSGPVASPVTLWGEYFGREDSEGLIKFNYDRNAVGMIELDGRADMIETEVPAGAISGPVSVVSNSLTGNALDFAVEECRVDADCGTQVCCPQNTYRKGRCVDSLNDCFVDIPTSVFEWKFSTGFGDLVENPYAYSCAGLSEYYGTCQTNDYCPNTPGLCSPYAGGQKAIADCDFSCISVSGCGGLGTNGCSYDSTVNRCLEKGADAICDLSQTFSYTLNSQEYEAEKVCQNISEEIGNRWTIESVTSCPDGWARGNGNTCIDPISVCSLCSEEFSCIEVNGSGCCASEEICPGDSICAETNKCLEPIAASCDCCCTIGESARDCCAGLQCEGTCGSDISLTDGQNNTNIGLGLCGGCASAGEDPGIRDATCNCSGHSGQYCEIDNDNFPNGFCGDCSSLSAAGCLEHAGVCCLDSRGTSDSADDICRGGSDNNGLVSADPSHPDFGYCAYYDCSATNANECAATNPLKIGPYKSLEICEKTCPQNDPCPGLTDFGDCRANPRCCFDSDRTTATDDDICRLGNQIAEGADAGWCAYYDCSASNPNQCASSTPVRGTENSFSSISACEQYCPNKPAGAGLICTAGDTSLCDPEVCNVQGFGCFSPEGNLGGSSADCGTCCCQPGEPITVEGVEYSDACAARNSKLSCEADKGNCSGDDRGLCCGCTNDLDCGSPENIGCGLDTCCQARPKIDLSSPKHLDNNVCRNAVLKVDFNKKMDTNSFNGNVLLLEERNYGEGVCPAGTFIATGESLAEIALDNSDSDSFSLELKQSRLVRLSSRLASLWLKLFGRFNDSALADMPDPNKLYCAVPGDVSSENNGESTSLLFVPKRLLSPAANYYLIVLGDTELNSRSGVLSMEGIGLNGSGYLNVSKEDYDGGNYSSNDYVEGENIFFNKRTYKNSQIIKFTTLSGQDPTSGICAIDEVLVSPSSYLFKTSENSLDENDSDPAAKTFDTEADRDKVFAARAYSANGQILRPVSGYFWDWEFDIANGEVASLEEVSSDRILVRAEPGITDGETMITATVNMERFLDEGNCNDNLNCVCEGEICSNNCCNFYTGGDKFNNFSNIYLFLCNNPWPPVAPDGTWEPWFDNCPAGLGASCADYNYKFYYCRDAGAAGTLDDLPAIIDQAVIRGISSNLICSSDQSPCVSAGEVCGADKNGDSVPDGICIWNVLKESYFFREALPAGSEIIEAIDREIGGTVSLAWRSEAAQVYSYKIYYSSGSGEMFFKELKASEVCSLVDGSYECRSLINNLENNIPYIFKISAVSESRTESGLSGELSVMPTDKVPPATPAAPSLSVVDSLLKFSWPANADKVSFYRLYRGVSVKAYGESFDSAGPNTSLSFPLNQFSVGNNYFSLSAFDEYDNESIKSDELSCELSLREGCEDFSASDCGPQLDCCSKDCSGKCGGAPDGCGGTCTADCPEFEKCVNQVCEACVPDCAGKCGGAVDGCGGYCDDACSSSGEACINQRCQQICTPDCAGKCGGAVDGCGGTCTTACPQGQECINEVCRNICTPDCAGKCGGAADGCGGTCMAACPGFEKCVSQVCQACVPSCVGKAPCADNGCGGTCAVPCNGDDPCLQISVDNFYEVYLNGTKVAITYPSSSREYIDVYSENGMVSSRCSNDMCWTDIRPLPVTLRTGNNVLAIKAINDGGVYGLAARLVDGCNTVISTNNPNNWVCTEVTPAMNWMNTSFSTNSYWRAAIETGKTGNGNRLYPAVNQLWATTASGAKSTADTIYCRYTF
ncbi:MAG: IPT/TIG domain-containing protein [Patescibacteria group bacterium]